MESSAKHIAIIMDGNGRWAKKQGQKRTFGHFEGVKNVRRIAICASRSGVKQLTLYAFSTENWKRPLEEVRYLMALPKIFFETYLKELMEENIRVSMIGEWEGIPEETKKYFRDAIERTSQNTGMTLCFAVNYGSRYEILTAVKKIAEDYHQGNIQEINEEVLESHLYTKGMPEIDLMIRTSGEKRISNFLLYQLAYSELMFVDCSWPEFTEEEFLTCLENFQLRNRRFGGLES